MTVSTPSSYFPPPSDYGGTQLGIYRSMIDKRRYMTAVADAVIGAFPFFDSLISRTYTVSNYGNSNNYTVTVAMVTVTVTQ